MSRLVVVVKSHLFPPFVRLNREIGTSRRHWGDGEFAAVNRKPRWAGTIPGSYMGRRQSSQSRWTGNPSEARRQRQLLTTLTHNRYLVRRTWYTVGGHTANTDTRAGADPGFTVGGCLGKLRALARAKFYMPHPLLTSFPHKRTQISIYDKVIAKKVN